MKSTREINLEEKLAELLAISDKSYEEIAQEIGVSASSISQYRKGDARPTLANLVSLSELFDVSLDYLVFGEDTTDAEIDAGPVIRHMNDSLKDSQFRQAQRINLVSNVGERISQKLDEEINEYLSDSATQKLFAGTMSNPEILVIERHSLKTRLFLPSFHYNILDPETNTPGKFFTTVVNNLNRGHEYQYLLPAANDDWESVIHSFRELLIDHLPSEAVVGNNCEFRVTQTPAMVGCGMYKIDEESLESEHPIIYDTISEHSYCSESWFGYSVGPSTDAQGTMIMDEDHLDNAIKTYEYLWEGAESI